MSNNRNDLSGFIITIEKVEAGDRGAAKEDNIKQLGDRIVSFIESKIPANTRLNLKLCFEHWDEIYSLEELVLPFKKQGTPIGNKDFSANYWIEG